MKRRNFIEKSTLLSSGILLGGSLACAQKAEAGLLQNKQVLFVYGGYEGHTPEKKRDLFVPWMKSEGAIVEVSNSLEIYANEKIMSSVDLVINCWTMGETTDAQRKGLFTAVKNGAGIAGWHGGMGDAFRNDTAYQYMVGGQFVAHPGGIVRYKVNITDTDDEITTGISDFEMNTEQYYMHIDPNVKVLATTTFNGDHDSWIDKCVIPVAWKKMFGKGRVSYCSPGHKMDDFEVPEFMQMIKRGIVWASKSIAEGPEEWRKAVYG